MKKSIFLLLICLSVATQLSFAQITEESKSMSTGLNNALVLEIPNTDIKFVEKLWRKQLKDFGGKTKKVKRDEMLTDDASVTVLNNGNTVDIYSVLSEAGDNVYLNMWIDMGGAYLSSQEHANEYTEAEKILMRFALDVAEETTRLVLEEEEKNLKKMEADLKRLERDNERYHRDIEIAKEKIKVAEENIETNVVEQDNTKKEIEDQKLNVEEVKRRLGDF